MRNPIRATRDHARSLRGATHAAVLRATARVRRAWNDPPVDLLIAGVFGTLVGRCYLYVSFIISSLVGGMIAAAIVLMIIAAFDIGVHALTVRSLIDWLRKQYSPVITKEKSKPRYVSNVDGALFAPPTESYIG